MKQKTIAILVGTGLWRGLSSLQLRDKKIYRNTKINLGTKTVEILYHEIGFYHDLRVVILPRHGADSDRPQRSPAELVSSSAHEAHIWFLSQLGVEEVYAFNTVGALDEHLPLANTHTFLIPDQLGYGLGVSFHSFGTKAKHPHPEMNRIFSEELRKKLEQAVLLGGSNAITSGTYIYSNLDHLESKVEGRALKRLFEDAENPVVGSTAGAELVLCKEMGINYALLCSISNYVQGTSSKRVAHAEILAIMEEAGQALIRVVESLLEIHQPLEEESICTN